MGPKLGIPAGVVDPHGPPSGAGIQIGYSTNVHPGGDLGQVRRSLQRFAVPIRKRLFGPHPSGLELRLGIGAAQDLLDPGRRSRFRRFLAEGGLEIFSINAYPLRDFHSPRVKEEAYRPPWTSPQRALWTRRIARILADLLEPGTTGSISTLGGTYRPWGDGIAVQERIARGYLEVLEHLADLEESSGRKIVLAVEPEPDTSFETARDVISFFHRRLLPAARVRWGRRWSRRRIEEVLRRHFTVNLDTCHLSVVFRSPAKEMEELHRAGIGIGKIHVTSAIAMEDPQAWAELRAMDEARYMHQARAADGRGRVVAAWSDLGRLPLHPSELPPSARAVRTHFHVPVHLARWGRLRTTQEETREAVLLALRRGLCNQLVIETYTWPVIRRRHAVEARGALIDGIVREFRWLLGLLGQVKA